MRQIPQLHAPLTPNLWGICSCQVDFWIIEYYQYTAKINKRQHQIKQIIQQISNQIFILHLCTCLMDFY